MPSTSIEVGGSASAPSPTLLFRIRQGFGDAAVDVYAEDLIRARGPHSGSFPSLRVRTVEELLKKVVAPRLGTCRVFLQLVSLSSHERIPFKTPIWVVLALASVSVSFRRGGGGATMGAASPDSPRHGFAGSDHAQASLARAAAIAGPDFASELRRAEGVTLVPAAGEVVEDEFCVMTTREHLKIAWGASAGAAGVRVQTDGWVDVSLDEGGGAEEGGEGAKVEGAEPGTGSKSHGKTSKQNATTPSPSKDGNSRDESRNGGHRHEDNGGQVASSSSCNATTSEAASASGPKANTPGGRVDHSARAASHDPDDADAAEDLSSAVVFLQKRRAVKDTIVVHVPTVDHAEEEDFNLFSNLLTILIDDAIASSLGCPKILARHQKPPVLESTTKKENAMMRTGPVGGEVLERIRSSIWRNLDFALVKAPEYVKARYNNEESTESEQDEDSDGEEELRPSNLFQVACQYGQLSVMKDLLAESFRENGVVDLFAGTTTSTTLRSCERTLLGGSSPTSLTRQKRAPRARGDGTDSADSGPDSCPMSALSVLEPLSSAREQLQDLRAPPTSTSSAEVESVVGGSFAAPDPPSCRCEFLEIVCAKVQRATVCEKEGTTWEEELKELTDRLARRSSGVTEIESGPVLDDGEHTSTLGETTTQSEAEADLRDAASSSPQDTTHPASSHEEQPLSSSAAPASASGNDPASEEVVAAGTTTGEGEDPAQQAEGDPPRGRGRRGGRRNRNRRRRNPPKKPEEEQPPPPPTLSVHAAQQDKSVTDLDLVLGLFFASERDQLACFRFLLTVIRYLLATKQFFDPSVTLKSVLNAMIILQKPEKAGAHGRPGDNNHAGAGGNRRRRRNRNRGGNANDGGAGAAGAAGSGGASGRQQPQRPHYLWQTGLCQRQPQALRATASAGGYNSGLSPRLENALGGGVQPGRVRTESEDYNYGRAIREFTGDLSSHWREDEDRDPYTHRNHREITDTVNVQAPPRSRLLVAHIVNQEAYGVLHDLLQVSHSKAPDVLARTGMAASTASSTSHLQLLELNPRRLQVPMYAEHMLDPHLLHYVVDSCDEVLLVPLFSVLVRDYVATMRSHGVAQRAAARAKEAAFWRAQKDRFGWLFGNDEAARTGSGGAATKLADGEEAGAEAGGTKKGETRNDGSSVLDGTSKGEPEAGLRSDIVRLQMILGIGSLRTEIAEKMRRISSSSSPTSSLLSTSKESDGEQLTEWEIGKRILLEHEMQAVLCACETQGRTFVSGGDGLFSDMDEGLRNYFRVDGVVSNSAPGEEGAGAKINNQTEHSDVAGATNDASARAHGEFAQEVGPDTQAQATSSAAVAGDVSADAVSKQDDEDEAHRRKFLFQTSRLDRSALPGLRDEFMRHMNEIYSQQGSFQAALDKDAGRYNAELRMKDKALFGPGVAGGLRETASRVLKPLLKTYYPRDFPDGFGNVRNLETTPAHEKSVASRPQDGDCLPSGGEDLHLLPTRKAPACSKGSDPSPPSTQQLQSEDPLPSVDASFGVNEYNPEVVLPDRSSRSEIGAGSRAAHFAAVNYTCEVCGRERPPADHDFEEETHGPRDIIVLGVTHRLTHGSETDIDNPTTGVHLLKLLDEAGCNLYARSEVRDARDTALHRLAKRAPWAVERAGALEFMRDLINRAPGLLYATNRSGLTPLHMWAQHLSGAASHREELTLLALMRLRVGEKGEEVGALLTPAAAAVAEGGNERDHLVEGGRNSSCATGKKQKHATEAAAPSTSPPAGAQNTKLTFDPPTREKVPEVAYLPAGHPLSGGRLRRMLAEPCLDKRTVLHRLAVRSLAWPTRVERTGSSSWPLAPVADLILTRCPNAHQLLNAQDSRGRTALHLAVKRRYEAVARYLLARMNRRGIELGDAKRKSAYFYATRAVAPTTLVECFRKRLRGEGLPLFFAPLKVLREDASGVRKEKALLEELAGDGVSPPSSKTAVEVELTEAALRRALSVDEEYSEKDNSFGGPEAGPASGTSSQPEPPAPRRSQSEQSDYSVNFGWSSQNSSSPYDSDYSEDRDEEEESSSEDSDSDDDDALEVDPDTDDSDDSDHGRQRRRVNL